MTTSGSRCSVCGTACTVAEQVACVLCEAVYHYHHACAIYQRRCAVYGCPSRVFVSGEASALGPRLLERWGTQMLADFGVVMWAFVPTACVFAGFALGVLPRTDNPAALLAAIVMAFASLASYFASGRCRLLSAGGDQVEETWFYMGRRLGLGRVHAVGAHPFFWVHDCGKGVDVSLADVGGAPPDSFPDPDHARLAVHHLRRMYAFSLTDPGELMPFIEAAERQDRPVLVAPREWVVSAIRTGLARRASLSSSAPRPAPACKEGRAT